MMIKSILTICAVASASTQNNSSNYDAKWSDRGKNIIQLAQSVPDLSELVTAVTAGDLVTALSGKGPFTVFAPTNEAFAKLPSKTLASLLDPKNIMQLRDVLTYHVISGAAVFSKDLKTFQMVKTLEGDDLKIAKAGRVIVGTDGAEVTSPDNAASNGVVHIINGVLIPPTPAPAPANHLWFRATTCTQDSNNRCRCGEVDAAPRMPASIFEPQNKAALQRYIDITVKFYNPGKIWTSDNGWTGLEAGRCQDIAYPSLRAGQQSVPWANGALMTPICKEQCHCSFGSYGKFQPGFPFCKDQPDDPRAGKFCSLCGPKYNGLITILYWFPKNICSDDDNRDDDPTCVNCPPSRPQDAAKCHA